MDVKITLPLLPLRDIVVFPSMVIPLFVGRDKSISALNEVMKKDKKIILVTQKILKLMIRRKQISLCMDVRKYFATFKITRWSC